MTEFLTFIVFKISEIEKGPWFLKKGLNINSFTKVKVKKSSRIIAIYFLSTIVADHIASAMSLSST